MPLKQTVKHLGLRALAAVRPSPRSEPLTGIRNFLLLQHATALGTVLHSTPLIRALHDAVPEAKIIVACSGFGREIFRGNPGVAEVVPMPSPLHEWRDAARCLEKIVRSMPAGPFATITPVGNERTAIALAAWRAGAINRVGHTLAPELYRAPMQFDFRQSQIENNLRIVAALGHSVTRHHEPQVFFTEEDRVYAAGLVAPAKLLAVFVTQTSPTQRKSWRSERFVAAAQFLVDRYGADIVFVGTAAESAAIETIRRSVRGRTSNVAGKTNLSQLAALLNMCDVGLTLDTGTMHLGRAVGLPMTIIAPAWSPPLEWLPLHNPRYTILKNADMPQATAGYIIDEVTVDEVTTSLADLISRYPR